MITNYPLSHLKISNGSREQFLAFVDYCIQNKKKSYCIPLHVTKYELAKRDDILRRAIKAADLVLADGAPITWLCSRLGYRGVKHITGIDFAESIIANSMGKKWSLYFLGTRPDILNVTIRKLREKYGGLNIVGAHDGFFKDCGVCKVIEAINHVRPDILLIGMGMPQKEYFIYNHLDKLQARFCLPVGGAFDIWAGEKRRSPVILQDCGLEWMLRSFYDTSKARSVFRHGISFMKDVLLLPR